MKKFLFAALFAAFTAGAYAQSFDQYIPYTSPGGTNWIDILKTPPRYRNIEPIIQDFIRSRDPNNNPDNFITWKFNPWAVFEDINNVSFRCVKGPAESCQVIEVYRPGERL